MSEENMLDLARSSSISCVSNAAILEPTSITIEGIQKLAEEMEARFPRKTTPVYFRMHPFTWMRLKTNFSPPEPLPLSISTATCSWKFSGIPIIEKDEMAEGIVEVLNANQEVIEAIQVYTWSNKGPNSKNS